MKFFPHVEKKSKKNGKIPMYMRVISNCKKAESRLPIEVFESEIQNWNKIIQRFENNKSSANRFLTKYEKEFEGLKYSLSEQSKEIKNILDENKIEYVIEDNSPRVSDFIIGQILSNNIAIKISPQKFEIVNALLEKESKSIINDIDPEHPLYSFNTEELMEVILKPDEWASYEVELAKKILKEKGIEIAPELQLILFSQLIVSFLSSYS